MNGYVHGLIGTDRHGAYNGWSDLHRQFCWAHLSRAFVKISERGGAAARIGRALSAEEKQMFVWWHRVRDGTLKRSSFRTYMKPLQNRVFALLKFDGGRSSISECQIDSCRTRFDQLSDLPLGGTVSVFNLLSANRKNEFAFSYFGGGGEVVAIASPGQPARMVLNKSEPLAAGEWIITLNKIQLQDSGRLLLSVFTTNDNFAILEAEPLN